MKSIFSVLSSILFLVISQQAMSSITITDNNTDTVFLKKDCSNTSNCATTLASLIPWIWNTRLPDNTNPLLVKIGTGTFLTHDNSPFSGSFCNNSGFVTFMGSGKENTVIKNSGTFNGISINNCQNLSFQDLTFDFQTTVYGIFWRGDGNSNYNNIQLLGGGAAWYDEACSTKSTHYFIGSQIRAKSFQFGLTSAYLTRCAETWFIGSELTAESDGKPVFTVFAEGNSKNKPEVHIYGSSLRATSPAGINITDPYNQSNGLTAAYSSNASVHIHGTGIDLISQEGNNLIALQSKKGGSIHANQSAYVMQTGSGGSKTRLAATGDGKIMAPYVWGDVSIPSGVTSMHGADISVSTDNLDQQPHLLIYSENCVSNWFDSTANKCRD